jgi:hypothetical protein
LDECDTIEDMPPPETSAYAAELGRLRRVGPWRADEVDVPGLRAAAAALGTSVIDLLRKAAARIAGAEEQNEAAEVRKAAEALYGLTDRLYGNALMDRREAAAREVFVSVTTFQRRKEKQVIDRLAFNVTRLLAEAAERKAADSTGHEAEWSDKVRDLFEVSRSYARDLRVPPDLLVSRTLETDLAASIAGSAPSGVAHVVVGEAGCGKSTVLWSLHEMLSARQDDRLASLAVVPVLLSASWVLPRLADGVRDELVAAMGEIKAARCSAVLLLDTADLMLHDEQSRQELMRLLDALNTGGVTVVLSSRPREAALLDVDDMARHELGPYDETELDAAVAALARRFCPAVGADDVAERLRRAEARGLPVADVCRSPLLLRMLFDLSAPDEPLLDDIDVTTLFRRYWQRRVQRDARVEAASLLRVDSSADYSRQAGHVGIALLAAGLAQAPEETLTATRAAGAAPGISASALDVLHERGVLVTGAGLCGFFHQSFFEYAAAKGLLATGNPDAISVLAARTVDGGGDLFVGCVLEQLLILARDNPLLLEAAQAATRTLLECENEAIQAIGLVAWAHQPELLANASSDLPKAGASALERAARMLPSIAGKSAGMALDQLLVMWQAADNSHTYAVILDAMARLARRAPKVVAEGLEYLDPVATLKQLTADPEFGGDTDGVRDRLLAVLEQLRDDAPHLVRSTLVAMLTLAGRKAGVELTYLTAQWPSIGDEHLLDEVLRIVADEYLGQAVAGELGGLYAAEWQLSGAWDDPDDWNDFMGEVTHPVPELEDTEIELTLCAVQRFAATLEPGDPRTTRMVEGFLSAEDERVTEILTGRILRDILDSQTPDHDALVAAAVSTLDTVGSDARRGAVTGPQNLLLSAMTRATLPDGLVAKLLPSGLSDEEWLTPELAPLLATAAQDGDPDALDLFQRLSRRPRSIPRRPRADGAPRCGPNLSTGR